MHLQFNSFIKTQSLIEAKESVLVAVSGGIDSMVLLHLFQIYSKINIAVAHCNFNLRDKESDKDEKLVYDYCKLHNIRYFVKSFDTEKYAKLNGISIQMAARKLRYQWFEELSINENYQKIALAQHLDDQTETFFINLIRGTGISGLHGILPIKGKLIRPLLFTNREEIEKYQQKEDVIYREDQSNKSDKYMRNFIRHQITPKFEELTSAFSSKLNTNIEHLREVETFYKTAIHKTLNSICKIEKGGIKVDIEALGKLDSIKLHLRELLFDKGFNSDTIDKVYAQIEKPSSGKVFYSDSHELLIDRDYLIIREIQNKKDNVHLIYKDENISSPISLKTEIISNDLKSYKTNENIALFDMDKIEFPLSLRKWKNSDYFYPLNMKGRQKLSDYFINNKFSSFKKEDTWVLQSGNDIIWIVGHRIDDRYKLTKNTKLIYKITMNYGTN